MATARSPICQRCAAPYVRSAPAQKYCTPCGEIRRAESNAEWRAARSPERFSLRCQTCGTAFVGKDGRQRFCGDRCRREHYRAYFRERARRVRADADQRDRINARVRKARAIDPERRERMMSHVREHRRRKSVETMGDAALAGVALSAPRPEGRYLVTCAHCGREAWRLSTKAIYCSAACGAEHRRRR